MSATAQSFLSKEQQRISVYYFVDIHFMRRLKLKAFRRLTTLPSPSVFAPFSSRSLIDIPPRVRIQHASPDLPSRYTRQSLKLWRQSLTK